MTLHGIREARHRAAPNGNKSNAGRVLSGTVPPHRHSRVLILARRTAGSPQLVEAVARRARRGPCNFTLLVPAYARGTHQLGGRFDPGQRAAERRIAVAVPLLSDAAGAEVVAMVGAGEPFVAVRDALAVMGFDEVIVSMLPAAASRWNRLQLPRRIRALGVPVIEVIGAEEPVPPLSAA
jgi:hypothetical protein